MKDEYLIEKLTKRLEDGLLDTPEQIVELIGNIGNRSDIRITKEFQAKAIRFYGASVLERHALDIELAAKEAESQPKQILLAVVSGILKELAKEERNL